MVIVDNCQVHILTGRLTTLTSYTMGRIETFKPVTPKPESNTLPYTYEEFLTAISVCELFLFTDKSVTIIPRRIKGETEKEIIRGFFKRVREKFSQKTIFKITDQQFQEKYGMLLDYFIRLNSTSSYSEKIYFLGDENYPSQEENMWKNFSDFSKKLKNTNVIDEEYKKIYRNYRNNTTNMSSATSEKAKEIVNEEKVVEKKEPVRPTVSNTSERAEPWLKDWLKNYDKSKVPIPLHIRSYGSSTDAVNQCAKNIVDMIRSGRYKSSKEIESVLNEQKEREEIVLLKKRLDAIKKLEESEIKNQPNTKKLLSLVESVDKKMQKLNEFLDNYNKTQTELEDLKIKIESMQNKTEKPAEKIRGFWHSIINWFK